MAESRDHSPSPQNPAYSGKAPGNVSKAILWWVTAVEARAKTVLAAFLFSFLAFSAYAYFAFSVNSDFTDLIQPSEKHSWYLQNEDFKNTFPQYQNTALVVVSGNSINQTRDAAQTILQALDNSGEFNDLFAPALDPFFEQHLLYSLELAELQSLVGGFEQLLPGLVWLKDEPTLENRLRLLSQFLTTDSAQTPQQLTNFSQAIEALANNQPANFAMVPTLEPAESPGPHYQVIVLKKRQAFSEKLPNAQIISSINQVIDNQQLPAGIQARITGEVALAHEEIQAGLTGIEICGLLSLILLAIILGVGVRSVPVISGIFAMLFTGIIWTLFAGMLMVGSFNTLTFVFLVMFFGLAVDFAAHYSLRALELQRLSSSLTNGQLANGGQAGNSQTVDSHTSYAHKSTAPALQAAALDTGPALALCMLTSAMAFMAFFPTAYKGLAELGQISAAGMVVALFLSLTFLPAWFAVFGFGKSGAGTHKSAGAPDRTGKAHDQASKARAPWILALLVPLIGLSVWQAKDLKFDYSVLAMRDADAEAMATLLELQRNEVATDYSISILVEQAEAELLKQELLALPSVARVELPEDLIPEQQQAKHRLMQPLALTLGGLKLSDAELLTPENTPPFSEQRIQAIEQMLSTTIGLTQQQSSADSQFVTEQLSWLQNNSEQWLKLENLISTAVTQDLLQLQKWLSAEPYSRDQLPEPLRERLFTDKVSLINVHPAFDLADRELMDQFISEVSAVAPNIAGRTVVEWGVGQVVVESFMQAATLATLVIFFLLLIYFRSLKMAALVFTPLLLTLLFTFAIAQTTGLSLNMANILVVPLVFGLGVDTGIHVVHRYQQAGSISAMLRSSTTRAVLISALTTIGTFASLSLSPHKGAASIGLILSIAISILIAVTYVVLPALLEVFDQSAKPQQGDRS